MRVLVPVGERGRPPRRRRGVPRRARRTATALRGRPRGGRRSSRGRPARVARRGRPSRCRSRGRRAAAPAVPAARRARAAARQPLDRGPAGTLALGAPCSSGREPGLAVERRPVVDRRVGQLERAESRARGAPGAGPKRRPPARATAPARARAPRRRRATRPESTHASARNASRLALTRDDLRHARAARSPSQRSPSASTAYAPGAGRGA